MAEHDFVKISTPFMCVRRYGLLCTGQNKRHKIDYVFCTMSRAGDFFCKIDSLIIVGFLFVNIYFFFLLFFLKRP